MSKVEALAQAYRVTGSSLALLELAVSGEEKALKLPHALIERLKEDIRPLGWQFVAAATVGPIIARLYFRNADTLFTKDTLFFGNDPSLAIFRELISYKANPGDKGFV